ncbi:hypothetical protein SAY87_023204 [Trapa incisa]|uniref:Uncharacterized protein n=1 Tax=Trapa incisa TaxID=236973 RepID=A0AAN7K924_9MYRT|nr:hypothetical protein SAY87_023204 [Trapa incisa]
MSTDRHSSAHAISTEENALFLDILHEAPLFAHRKPTRIYGSIFYCLLLAGYAILAAGAPWIFQTNSSLIPSLLCSCNAALLIITGIFQQYLVYQVHKIRLQGYYSFSQKLKYIVRWPFAAIAYGTAAMLLVIVWHPNITVFTIPVILRIIMIVEVICAASFMSIYIGYVHQYNSLNSQPDVLKSLYSPLQQSSPLEGVRYDGGRLSDQQMALLQYQRENLHFLSEEILRLQESLSKYERTDDGSTPQVDLAHLLAARDQELRTLSAEMNQLQSELRLARSLIAERDSEIQRVRTTNNQYVEENERLRAILGEWSARTAKDNENNAAGLSVFQSIYLSLNMAASKKLRSSCSFPNLLLSCLSLVLFILSAASIVPTVLLRMPPTSLGFAFLMVSGTSLVSSFVGVWSRYTRFCFCSHMSLLLAALAGQLLAVLALFTKEEASLSMFRSTRDPREAKLLARLECGALMAMMLVQVVVLVLTWIVHHCWVRELEELEAEREATERRRRAKAREAKGGGGDEKVVVKWVKTDFEG